METSRFIKSEYDVNASKNWLLLFGSGEIEFEINDLKKDGSGTLVDLIFPFYSIDQKADLLLFPSKHESFGMVAVEAMACGTPVVALQGSGGPDEIINDGLNGVLSPQLKYSKVVFELISNQDRLKKLSHQCRLDVIENWSQLKTSQLMRKSIESVFKI